MIKSQRTILAEVCLSVIRYRPCVSLSIFRLRCDALLPPCWQIKDDDSVKFRISISKFLDEFYAEWQKKEKWNKHFREKC